MSRVLEEARGPGRRLAPEERARKAGILACSRNFGVSTCMIRVEAGVHDELDGIAAEFAHRGHYLFGEFTCPGIYQQSALFTNLHGDIAAVAHQHVNVPLNLQYVNLAVIGIR